MSTSRPPVRRGILFWYKHADGDAKLSNMDMRAYPFVQYLHIIARPRVRWNKIWEWIKELGTSFMYAKLQYWLTMKAENNGYVVFIRKIRGKWNRVGHGEEALLPHPFLQQASIQIFKDDMTVFPACTSDTGTVRVKLYNTHRNLL